MLKFKIEKSEEKITSHAGLILLSEYYEYLGLDKLVNLIFPKPGSDIGYMANNFVLPLLLMQIGGGEALAHVERLSEDKPLMKLLNMEIPKPATIGRWLERQYPKAYEGLESINNFVFEQVLSKDKRTDYTFDPDATAIESHKESAEMTYKGFTGYMPMLGCLSEIPLFIVDDFREGNAHPGSDALSILERAMNNMPEGKRIARLRSDSAWYQAAIINYCESEKIKFTITADKDKAVMEAISNIKDWKPCLDKDGKPNGREYGETSHSMEKTKDGFRLIVQRWKPVSDRKDLPEYFYHVIATNYKAPAQEVIYWHNLRASSENYNKEIKLGFGMEHIPCQDFGANALYFRIGILAYNLIIAMKELLLPEEFKKKTIKTMRWLWINTWGKLISHSGKLILKLDSSVEGLFEWWRNFKIRKKFNP